jgi:hypothetical protein
MPISFAKAILPLFRQGDIACMSRFGVQLDDYAYMGDPGGDGTYPDYANARDVYAHLTGATSPRMPAGGPYWSDSQLELFDQWMTDGFQA